MSTWGETKTVARVADAVDQNVPPGAMDPKARLPVRLMTSDEAERASKEWTIVGGNGGIVEVPSSCLGSDTRSSMEAYWRRRPVIVGADIARFWSNLFSGQDPTQPGPNVVPIPQGWQCGPWRRNNDTAPVQMPAGGIVQRFENWWRICSPPQAPRPQPAPRRAGAVLRPPTSQTPRPAPPKPPARVPQQPTRVQQAQPLPGMRPSTCGPWLTTPQPAQPAAGDRIETRQRYRAGNVPMAPEWRRCLISAQSRPSTHRAIDTQGTAAQLDVADEVMRWLEGQEALAAELATQPPDVRRAILVENPEVLYVWWLLGWIEFDENVRQTFWTLAGELREVGLSLWDFEEAARADLPASVAHELRAAPIGPLSELVMPGPSSTQVAAGQWDAQTGVFLPTDPNVLQRPSYGYTPQPPRLPSETTGCGPWRTDQANPRLDQRIEARGDGAWRECDPSSVTVSGAKREKSTTISGCGCEARPAATRPPTIGGPLTVRDGDRGLELEHLPCATTRVAGASIEDPRCCPECAIEHLGSTARAWCAGIANPSARVGDFWSDLGRGVAAADRWLSDNVWANVKDVVPYGDVIDAAHQTRMRALEAAAPEFYPSRGTASASRPPARPPAKSAATRTAAKPATTRRPSTTSEAATDRAITAATRLASGVRAGDARVIATVKGIKDRAEAGDPEARRNWRVYVLVARDLHGAA